MYCVNKNHPDFINLVKITGLTDIEVAAMVGDYFEKYQEFPTVDQFLQRSTTEKALAKEYNLTKRGDHYTLDNGQEFDIPSINNKYRDVEVQAVSYPLLGDRIVIKPRAILNRDLKGPESQMLPTPVGTTQDIFPIYKDPKYNYYLYQFGSTIYRTPCRVSRPTLLVNYPSYKTIIEAQNDLSTLPFVNKTYSVISSINENLNKLQQGQEITIESNEPLPSSVRINKRAFYSDYQFDESIDDPYQNNNGTIIINPRYIEQPEQLEEYILKAQGYNQEFIDWVLQGDTVDYEIIQVDTNKYTVRKANNTTYNAEDMPVVPPVRTFKQKNNDRLNTILDRLEKLYGVKFHRVTTAHLMQGSFNSIIENATSINAFILDGEIYINMDRASSDAPIHEISHIILGSLKFTNPNMYYNIVSSVEQLEDYQQRLEQYPNRSRSDANEEIFVDMFAKHFTQGTDLPLDKLTQDKLEYEVKHTIDSAIFPNTSTTKGTTVDIMNSTFEEIMDMFGTCINRDAFIQAYEGNSVYNRKLANLKEELIKRGDLKEYCTDGPKGGNISYVHKRIKIK